MSVFVHAQDIKTVHAVVHTFEESKVSSIQVCTVFKTLETWYPFFKVFVIHYCNLEEMTLFSYGPC